MGRIFLWLSPVPLEACIWLGGLLVLALLDPRGEHMNICLFRNLGLPYCPGCGLGRSISLLFHGEVVGSWHAHPLGSAAVALLLSRSVALLRQSTTTSIHRPRRKERPWPMSSR